VKTFEQDTLKVWYDEHYLSISPEQCFDLDYWHRHSKVVGSAKGRGITWFVQLDGFQGALRHYRRGGLFSKLVSDHYIFRSWEKTRSYQELIVLNHLKNFGVNVPAPIAARAIKRHFCYQADLMTEKIPYARDLVSILQEREISDDLYRKIGREIRKMHDAQVNHTDLNIHNILIDMDENVWIIDFDKCFIGTDGHWKRSNLSRMRRSFLKEKQKRNIHWKSTSFNLLYQAYGEVSV